MDTEISKNEEGHYVNFYGKVYLTEPMSFKRGGDYVFVVKANCRGLHEQMSRAEEPERVASMKIFESKQA